jgi:LAO/AO transport system kinase
MTNAATMTNMAGRVLQRDQRAIARVLRYVEDGDPGAESILKELYFHTGSAHVIGITGTPGGGKSTLVAGLAQAYRRSGRRVGILAIDPSSPFSGGAILGDRIRMSQLSGDEGIFIRSMATRGALGGLARGAVDAISVMDAAGFDVIMLETVGVGQDEVDVARVAHSVVLVSVPGLGDDIQTMKAGVLEIADIYVVNKADLDGAHSVAAMLQMMLSLAPSTGWIRPIVPTTATKAEGIEALVEAIARHRLYLEETRAITSRKEQTARKHVLALAQEELLTRIMQVGTRDAGLAELVSEVAARRLDPYSAARRIVGALVAKQPERRA